MRTAITPEHAEHNAQALKDSQAEFESLYGFENPVTGNNGWITPGGKLWPNPFESHLEFCDMWFGEPEWEIEKTHVKLSDGTAHFYGKRLTSKQMKTLLDYEYDPEEVISCGRSERAD